MDCPRCHLPLRPDTYEGVEIDFCDSCWGCWLDRGELPAIIRAHEMEFSDADRARVLDLKGASRTGPRGVILCPRCGTFMEQLRYHESLELLVDRCPQHGIWLDGGELKAIQVVAEQSRDIQAMLIRKLKLLDQE